MVGDDAPEASEEIRLACVFNGGVSLAVWMGGVAHEFNQFTAAAACYGPLQRLLGVRARADVISGTSAGGINGAALALAQVNRHTDLTDLRRVWGEQGRMETLLHKPFRGAPTSLLRGEEVFLPELVRALHRLAAPWAPRDVSERPVDLTVTTTLLDGVSLQETDTFGQSLTQDRHDVYFRFARMADDAGGVRDDFVRFVTDPAGEQVPLPQEGVLDALGLAARASAGFPVAFEPTLIPVDPASQPAGRPDMARYASWRGEPEVGDAARPDRSRYAVDGGLLNNTPTQHALAAIQRMPAGRAVDRVMVLVVPLPSPDVVEQGATVESAPSLTAMARGLATSVTSTGNRTFVDDVVRHNRMATSQRGTRRDVIAAAGTLPDLRDSAAHLFPHYRRLRLRRDARDLAAQPPLPPGMVYDQVRTDLEAVQQQFDGAVQPTAGPRDPTDGESAGAVSTTPWSLDALLAGAPFTEPASHWDWGTKPVLDIAAAALEYLAHLLDAWPVRDRGPVLTARAGVHDAMATARWVHRCVDEVWTAGPRLSTLRPDRCYWRLRLAAQAWFARGTAESLVKLTVAAAAAGVQVERDFAPVVQALSVGAPGPPPAVADAGGLAGWHLGRAVAALLASTVAPANPGGQPRSLQAVFDEAWQPMLDAASIPDAQEAMTQTWNVLACLHVTAWTIGDELPTENTNPLRLTQLSAATRSDFATFSQTVQEKLGGASLARFSGFLKRSWRMNDWAWGRFDASSTLLRILLTPRRVRRAAVTHGLSDPADVVDLLLRAAWGDQAAALVIGAADDAPELGQLVALRSAAAREVAAALRATVPAELRDDDPPDAPSMPELAALLAYGRHLAIVHEELPEVVRAVQEDASDGANPRSRGELFITQHGGLLERLAETRKQPGEGPWLTTGLEALAAFDRSGIGREPLEEEGASDQMIRTTVTAAAVATTVAGGKNSGLGVLNPVIRAVKGLVMVPYWVTQGVTAGGLVARSLAILGLATGGVLLTLALLGVLDGALAGIAAMLGAGVLLTALTYGAMRTGSQLHAVMLAVAAVVLVAAGTTAARGTWDVSLGLGSVLGAAVVVLGLMLLGSVHEPLVSPKALVEDAAVALVRRAQGTGWAPGRIIRVRAVGRVVAVVLLVVLVVAVVAWGAARLDRLPTWASAGVAERGVLLGVVVAGCCVVATAAVVILSRGLRRWQLVGDDWRRERSSGSAGVAAGWSVVYGTVALLACSPVLRWWPDGADIAWPVEWVVAGLVLIAVVLMLPWPLITLTRSRRKLLRRARAALGQVGDDSGSRSGAGGRPVVTVPGGALPTVDHAGRALTGRGLRQGAWLEANGWAYSALVRPIPVDGVRMLELR